MAAGRHLACVALALVGCGADRTVERDGDDANIEDDGVGAARWETPVAGLAGALLGVWGDERELWAVGADPGDGSGPMVLRGTMGAGWARVDVRPADPEGGHLWWVFGAGERAVWMVGERGRVLRVAREDSDVVRVPSGTDATLYGLWGTSEEALWAVGGYVHPRTGPPTIVRLTRAGGEVVPLPDGLAREGALFKVWGAAADDVWAVGEAGMVLHWDGRGWARVPTEGSPRLVTVHGRDAANLVAVGGTSHGVILEGPGLVARALGSTASVGPLAGVQVGVDGGAWAVGFLGTVLRREGAAGDWAEVRTGLPPLDWHAVWIDAHGDPWLAGGDLLSRLDAGALARFGPPRAELPRGEVRGLEPGLDVETSEVDASDSAVLEVDSAGAEIIDAGPVDTVADAAVEDAPEPDADTSEPGPYELGALDATSGAFIPYVPEGDARIIHGPQGGIHVEVVVRFACPAEVTEAAVDVTLRLEVDGAEHARYLNPGYPLPAIAPGMCQSYVIPLIFDHPDASLYAGRGARLKAELGSSEGVWRHTLDLVLVDAL